LYKHPAAQARVANPASANGNPIAKDLALGAASHTNANTKTNPNGTRNRCTASA